MKRGWAIAIVGVLILLAASAYLGRWLGGGRQGRFPSSFRAEPEGTLAFRRLLEEMGYDVKAWTQPWDALPRGEPGGVLLVATPLQRDPDPAEQEALRSWLRAGGSLLVVDDATVEERSVGLDAILVDAGLERRWPIVDLNPETLLPHRPRLTDARGTRASPAGEDLRELRLHADAGLSPDAEAIPLAVSTPSDLVAGEGRIGNGRVIRVLGPLLANDRIAEGDHLRFALQLVESLAGSDPIRFDEYHHGYGGIAPVARRLDPRVLVWAALQVLAAALLYGLARGIRFGPARPQVEPPRRSSLEFVRSMASLYMRARAGSHVLEVLLNRFAREARARWGLAEELDLENLGRAVARRSDIPEERVLRPLRDASRALRTGSSIRDCQSRAREVARLEEEVFGAHRQRT